MDKIICPHCQKENWPLDNEEHDIQFTTMECEHCNEKFNMSRKIDIKYDTWI